MESYTKIILVLVRFEVLGDIKATKRALNAAAKPSFDATIVEVMLARKLPDQVIYG